MGGAAQATCRSPPARSSSAGWPSPACRRSRASGRRTRSSPTPCTRTSALYARRPVHRAAHRVLHEPPGLPRLLRQGARWNDPIEPSTHEAHSDAEAAAERGRDADAAPAGGRGRGRRGRAPRGPPPRVALDHDGAARRAGRARRHRRVHQPAVRRQHQVPRELARAGHRPLRRAWSTTRNGTIVALLADLDGRRPRRHRRRLPRLPPSRSSPADVFEQPLFLHGWYYDWAVSALHGRPRPRRRSTPSPGSTARSSTAPSTASAPLARDSGSIVRRSPDRPTSAPTPWASRSAPSCSCSSS